jgi:hypothetical protein
VERWRKPPPEVRLEPLMPWIWVGEKGSSGSLRRREAPRVQRLIWAPESTRKAVWRDGE